MGRDFERDNSEHMTNATAVAADEPMTMAIWIKPETAGIDQHVISISHNTTASHYHRIFVTSSDTITFRSRAGEAEKTATTTATITAGQWHHICGTLTAAGSDRNIYLDGANKVTNTVDRDPSLDYVTIAGLNNGGTQAGSYFDGLMAEAAFWNVLLTDNEVAALGNGVPVLRIRPLSLVAYWPLLAATGNAADYSGNGKTMTDVNTVLTGDHPPVGPLFAFPVSWQPDAEVAVGAAVGFGRRAIGRGIVSGVFT